MDHCGTIEIETERLFLRRYVIDDAVAMYNNWASDDEVTKFLMWKTHGSSEVSKSVVADWVQQYSDEKYYHWAIVLKENGDEPIGDIAVVHMNEEVSIFNYITENTFDAYLWQILEQKQRYISQIMTEKAPARKALLTFPSSSIATNSL